MKTLNNRSFKKGQTIILITPWNHHYNMKRDSYADDSYNVKAWTIGSIGKKEMHLLDDNGNKGDLFRANSDGNFLTYWHNKDVQFFASNENEIGDVITNLRNNDEFKTENYLVNNIRF